jgi:transcriptional regulator with XRE-family HTH domain
MADNNSIAAIVRAARKNKGWSQPELARRVTAQHPERRLSQQLVDKIETGRVKHSSFLPAIAQELGIPVDRVLRLGHSNGSIAAIPGHQLVAEGRDLPVYAATQRGVGVQVLSAEPVEYVSRPEPLARVRDGYGVMAPDDTMLPQYRAGDIVLINPHMPPRAGDTCVFRSDDNGVVIRFLRKVTEEEWHVTEWSSLAEGAKRDYKLKRAEWPTVHLAVGCYARR